MKMMTKRNIAKSPCAYDRQAPSVVRPPTISNEISSENSETIELFETKIHIRLQGL